MRHSLLTIAIAFFLISCKEDDTSKQENSNSVAVGEKIYTIEQGADQEGAKGQYLDEYIKISVTDFEGGAQSANLIFELSDEGGQISPVYARDEGEEDWLVYRWKLGCTDQEQKLTIKDNVCGIARDGCVDIILFELTVAVNGQAKGWVEYCDELNFGYNGVNRMFAHENEFLVYTSSNLFTTTDISTGTWSEYSTYSSLGTNDIWKFEGGIMIYENGSSLYRTKDNGRSWNSVNLPSYGTGRITILNNGTYIYAGENTDVIYESGDEGSTWQPVIENIETLTGSFSTQVLALTSSGDKAYIITSDYYIIELDGSSSTLHTFLSSDWNGNADMDETYAYMKGNLIYVISNDYNNYSAKVLDFNTMKTKSTLPLNEETLLITSQDVVYLVPKNIQNYYYKYENSAFNTESIDLPEGVNNYSTGYLAIFKGSPIFYSRYSNKLYYYNN